MIMIKCCANCESYDDGTCTVDCHSTTSDDWCPRWEDNDGTESDCCWNCKYFKGTYDDGKTKCGNPDQWNTWIKPQEGCEWWKEAHNDNH